MRMGALLGPVTEPANANFLPDQARRFEGAGFSSLWAAQAIGRGFLMPDPFLMLTAAATATDTVELGTAVLQVPLYQPADIAYRAFALQQLSGGRLILGVGAGSTVKDFAVFGRDYDARFTTFNAALPELRDWLTTGARGEADLTPWSNVRDATPLFYGTWGKGVKRAASEFDGWIASGAYRTVDEVCDALETYRGAGGGRAIVSTLQITAETDLGEFSERLARFAEAGFDDAVVMLMPGAPDPEAVRALL